MMREVIECQRARSAVVDAARRAADLEEARRAGRLGRAAVVVAADIGGANEYVWYAASKARRVDNLWAQQGLASDGIRVNCVSPGASETRIHADAGTPEKLAKVAR